jgi:antitoxin component of MazEF toxin-antitoxin module
MENTQKPTFKYIRKAERIGGSILVVIPAIWVKANDIQDGDELMLEVTAEQVTIKKQKPNQNQN